MSYTVLSGITTPSCSTTTRDGYTFAGWLPASIAPGSTGNKTIVAQWTPVNYTISYDGNSGTTGGCAPTSYTIESGIITPSCITLSRTGYSFASWSPTNIPTNSTGNKTFTANWTANNCVA